MRSEGGGDHRRHAQRHRPRPLPAASSGQVFRRGHRRGACRAVRRRAWRPRASSRSAPSTPRSCSAPSIPIVHDVCLQNLPVVFCMDRGGLSADDGPTHHGLFDISYLRGIPNIVHMVPKDEDELADMLFTAMQWDGPDRGALSARPGSGHAGEGRAAQPFRSARPNCCSIATTTASRSSRWARWCRWREEIARKLESEGVSAAVINARFAKPIDVEMLGVLRAQRGGHRDAGRPRAARRLRQRGAGGVEPPRARARRWCASAGRTSSSSTASSTSCARNMASRPRRRWRGFGNMLGIPA